MTELSRSYPDYLNISDHFSVPTLVKPLSKANVCWLNRNWFKQNGYEADSFSELETLKNEILREFAVGCLGAFSEEFTEDVMQTRYADRYGGTGGAFHGGSGRCIHTEQFIAKGVGPTPLVPDKLPHSYSHGYLQLSQGIKQTVMSLICDKRFPSGAIPVVALIDTGFDYDFERNGNVERCCIVVRPNFLRFAHMERSIFFGTSGYRESDQFLDSLRTMDCVEYILKSEMTRYEVDDLETLLFKWLDQICNQFGYGRAHRIWGDNCVSSNLCVGGAWCDLELFQSLPSWGKANNQVNHVFGSEAFSILDMIKSVTFYLKKYGHEKNFNTIGKLSQKYIEEKIHHYFLKYVHECVGADLDDNSKEEILSYFNFIYKHQQNAPVYDGENERNYQRYYDDISKPLIAQSLAYFRGTSNFNKADMAKLEAGICRLFEDRRAWYGASLRKDAKLLSNNIRLGIQNAKDIDNFIETRI